MTARNDDLDAQRIAKSFRPQWPRLALIVGTNLLLAGLLLGIPYARGRRIAREERAAFARFVSCLLGGSAAPAPGIGLPLGDRDHFASNVLFAPSRWPLICRGPLRELAPEDAVFLWPSVKQAGADLRAVVKLVDDELVTLHRARREGTGRVPQRALVALAKLQAVLTLMAKATDVTDELDNDAVRFAGPLPLATPARLPLLAAESAMLDVNSSGGALEAFALDSRGISWLRLDAGKIDRDRVKRTGLVRAVVRSDGEPYVVWATSPSRCKEREDHCAARATGIARYSKGAGALPTPRWLGGHPAGRADRVLRIAASGAVDMLALADAEGHLDQRHYQLDLQAATPENAPPLAATASIRVADDAAVSSNARFVDVQPRAVAFVATGDGEAAAHVVWPNAEHTAIALPSISGTGGETWLTACDAGSAHWLGYGSASAFRIARLESSGDPIAIAPMTVATSEPQNAQIERAIDGDNPALDRVRLVCDADRAWLFYLDNAGALQLSACGVDGQCRPSRVLAQRVVTFSALLLPTETRDAASTGGLLAFSRLPPAREIRLLRLDGSGAPLGEALTPAACWDPFGGLCGVPNLVRDGARVVLTARDGQDLLAIESEDGGAHFETLQGLKVGAAFDPSAHDPLQQHRVRKGLE